MIIKTSHYLSEGQEQDVRNLITEIKFHDRLTREPYLSNILNFDQEMPCFYLAYEGDELRGFLTVYADEAETPDLFIWVTPAYRRQGIARQLFAKYQEETETYNLGKPSFIIERHFLEANSGLLEAWQVSESGEREYWMGRGRDLPDLVAREGILVCQADSNHLEAVATFQARVFDEPIEVTRNYAKGALADEKSLLYIVLEEDNIVASCTVDLSSGQQLLYGLAVRDDKQGKGIGTYMTAYILSDRIEKDERPFQIAVEADNLIAKHLYEKLGFRTQSEITYVS